MIIYGRNTVLSRIANNNDIEELYLIEGMKDKRIVEASKDIPVKYMNRKQLDKLCATENHQGIAAKVHTYDYHSLQELLKDASKQEYPILVMLDGVDNPSNLGAIMRTCECIGVSGIITSKHNSCPLTSTVAKVSTGAIDYVKVAQVTNLTQTITKLKEEGYWIVGAEASGDVDYRDVDYKTKICLVMGSEGKGISQLVYKQCDFKVRLPMVGQINSLNVSNATAILLYQIYSNRYPSKK